MFMYNRTRIQYLINDIICFNFEFSVLKTIPLIELLPLKSLFIVFRCFIDLLYIQKNPFIRVSIHQMIKNLTSISLRLL